MTFFSEAIGALAPIVAFILGFGLLAYHLYKIYENHMKGGE